LAHPTALNSAAGSRKAVIALCLLALIWGYNWVQMKVGVLYAPPFQFAALRVTLGALSLFGLMAILQKPLWPQEIRSTLLAGVLQISGTYGFGMWALVSGGAGKTSVLVYIMPFWTLFLAWAFLKEKISQMQWVAIAVSVCGLLLILEPTQLGGTLISKVLAVMAGACWGGGAVIAKKLRQTVELDLLSFTAWQTLFAALPLTLIAIAVPAEPIQWTPTFMLALLYNVIPGTAIATLLWLFILHQLPAGTASLGLLMNPVIAVFAAWLQLGEVPSSLEAVGMGLIVAGLILNALQAMRSPTGRV
jgi:drug/metabolite transporter (DMT)-like permease